MARHFRRQALAWLTAVAAPAFADAPLVSETADVIGGDACQIEAAVSRARARGTAPMSGNDVLGSCGLGGHSQAAPRTPLASPCSAGTTGVDTPSEKHHSERSSGSGS